ncbi:MAG: hypothetical protein ACPGPS_09880 [Rubripirellula sp.]
MTISSFIIALLCFMSLVTVGMAILVFRALRPAEPSTNTIDPLIDPDSILDPLVNAACSTPTQAQVASRTDAQAINPYRPHTAETQNRSAW